MTTQLIIVIVGLVGSVIGAFIGYVLGFLRFRSERLWERIAEIYVAIFDALNNLAEDIDQEFEEMHRGTPMTDEQKIILRDSVGAATQLTKKHARIGSFFLSKQSVKNLDTLLMELRKASVSSDWVTHLVDRSDAIHNAINNLKESARNDLKT